MKILISFLCMLVPSLAMATSFSGGTSADGQLLGLDGRGTKIVVPKCNTMTSYYNCRNVDNASADVKAGFELFHHTLVTIGPRGNIVNPDGSRIFPATHACSSCHFGGGQTPTANPVYQSVDKYSVPGGVYFRSFNYKRDVKDAINDCMKNCGGGNPVAKDSTVMTQLVAYITWIRDGITDPTMKTATGWKNMPGEAMPIVDPNWKTMKANPTRGKTLYKDKGCLGCHDKDAPGQGEIKPDDKRPSVPSLWGDTSFSWGAAYNQVPNLAGVIKGHMPFGSSAGTLSSQDALDLAGYINSQPRVLAYAGVMYCANDPTTGIPNTVFKPAAWVKGCTHPEEPFPESQRLLGPWQPIIDWRANKLQEIQSSMGGS